MCSVAVGYRDRSDIGQSRAEIVYDGRRRCHTLGDGQRHLICNQLTNHSLTITIVVPRHFTAGTCLGKSRRCSSHRRCALCGTCDIITPALHARIARKRRRIRQHRRRQKASLELEVVGDDSDVVA